MNVKDEFWDKEEVCGQDLVNITQDSQYSSTVK